MQAVASTNAAELSIRTKFIETTADIHDLAYEWLRAGFFDSSLRPPGTALQQTGKTPGVFPGVSGVLEEVQAQKILRALSQRKDTDLMSESAVTTLSGRQVQIQSVDMKTVVTGIRPEALTPPGIRSTNGVAPPNFITEIVPLGPTLDVTASIAPDGQSIDLHLIPSVVEFLGYDSAESVGVYVDGKSELAKKPLPHFRIRNVDTHQKVLDGQTVLLGYWHTTDIVSGQVVQPIVKPGTVQTNLLVFVKATIVDAAGKPLHAPPRSGAEHKK